MGMWGIIFGFLIFTLVFSTGFASANVEIAQCGNVSYFEDYTEPGRISEGGEPLVERDIYYVGNILTKYLFEGEKIHWDVLVVDPNGVENIEQVYVTIGDSPSTGNNIVVNCFPINEGDVDFNLCNLDKLNETYSYFNSSTMEYYDCTLTIETPDSMQGLYWTVPEARDLEGNLDIFEESIHIFANPIVSLTINDTVKFSNLTPGRTYYSNSIEIVNSAEENSGVRLDMFISGTDFFDANNLGAKCPDTNMLELINFAYYAENGIYSTLNDLEIGRQGNWNQVREKDNEGYVNIGYGIGFDDPWPFYEGLEIIQDGYDGIYYAGNIINQGESMNLNFKFNVPDICKGNFDTGDIYFWGEAI
ncbi:MAG: hypothetical protein KC506_01875 [Nanoarchaeota archaeon]|nr:hypothetical protein [Nanoarchaeota archaeon]